MAYINGQEILFSAYLGNNRGIPEYIKAEAERVASAVQATRTAQSLVFPIISDPHLFDGNSAHEASLLSAQYAGMGIIELKRRLHIDFTAYLGDYTWGAADHTAEQVKADITAFKETTYTTGEEIWCVGNHDLNYGKNRDRLLTLDEVYGHIGANSDGVKPYANIERGYGYLDFENQKIRVIYLNTCDASDGPSTAGANAPSEWISPIQIQWLADTALNFADKADPSEWGIVIIGHHPLHYGYSCFDKVMQLLEAYRNTEVTSGSITGCCVYHNGPTQKVNYNFANTKRAEIICNIHGHNHNCAYSQISSTTRAGSTTVAPWLWRFCIPQICAGRYNGGYDNFAGNTLAQQNFGEVDGNGNPVYWYKEAGTAKATSFCVVNVDRKNKKVYAYIFGAGKDRAINYTEGYMPAEFNISVTVNNCAALISNPPIISENGTASLGFTANSGYELPDSVTVTGASYTWNKASGTLILSNPTSNVSVSITAVEIATTSYTNLIKEVGVSDGYISSSSGSVGSKTGYKTTGYIPIGYGSANSARGEQVLYLKDIEALKTDSSVRVGFYRSDKTFIKTTSANAFLTEDDGSSVTVCTIGNDGFIATIDFTGYSSYLHTSGTGTPAYIRFCSKGIDESSILTLNEPIE